MDLNDIDFEDIGRWPALYMIVACILAFVLVVGGMYWFFTKDHLKQFDTIQAQEAKLKTEFKSKQQQAKNLEPYKLQMAEMEKRFGTMLKQLPKQTEVADLLVEVSQTGLSNGLEFSLFKPGGEVRREFYAELPISIKVTGNYHQFGGFVSEIAALPRIVTIHDVAMSPNKAKASKNVGSGMETQQLNITLLAKTYRYLEDK
ncbi:MAG: type 4a pilus biogenesis protein PilO [Gammaproteobacteria bacterium]|nr:type 4a pilus biogenesis protein PilO [Gammaproteobacteria bacterium]